MQPLDNIKSVEPNNPLREKYSDLIVRLFNSYQEDEMKEIESFLNKFRKPFEMLLLKYSVIGHVKNFDD